MVALINNVDYFSCRTSCNRVPTGIKHLAERRDYVSCNLDYGGGRYDTATKYLEGFGIENHVYDPYNRSAEHNTEVLSHEYDSVTLLNVLNVIESPQERIDVIRDAYGKIKEGIMIIQIYEGNKSGFGTISKKQTYQGNRKADFYVEEVKEALDGEINIWHMDRKKKFIIINKGKYVKKTQR
jgi:hypothetical protein